MATTTVEILTELYEVHKQAFLRAFLEANDAVIGQAMADQVAQSKNGNTERLAYTPTEVAKVTGISRAVVYRQINAGKLRAKRLGGRTYVLRSEVERFLDEMESI